ncbi:Gfo/Idh/MocA family oxidoreductase [Nakamurella sp.]|uniref:Gfo/Idh/MocA family oxidoreductase n=1 Tax=Nakamurella sp. TaxID=1869182 RepID=UPI003B39FF7A
MGIGVIGAGVIGRTHLAALARDAGCRIVGLADPTPAAAEVAGEFGVPLVADHRDLLATPGLDAVIVATPTALHVPIGLDAIAAGMPALIEKPVAPTVAQALTLAAAAERAGVPVLVGHHRRHNPIVAAARAAVRSGRLGRLTTVTALWTLRKPDGYYDIAWRREPGGGPVLTNLIHDVDVLRFVCGEIDTVQAIASSAGRGLPITDTAAVALRFASGAVGTITLSDAVAAPWAWDLTAGENPAFGRTDEQCYLLAGTAGSLAVPGLRWWRYPDPDAATAGWHRTLVEERLPVVRADPYARQLAHFRAVVRGEATPLVGVRDATATLAATLAVEEAAATGRPVDLAPPAERPAPVDPGPVDPVPVDPVPVDAGPVDPGPVDAEPVRAARSR